MGVLVLAAALLALTFKFVPQQVPTTDINYLLGVVMFGMGLTLKRKISVSLYLCVDIDIKGFILHDVQFVTRDNKI